MGWAALLLGLLLGVAARHVIDRRHGRDAHRRRVGRRLKDVDEFDSADRLDHYRRQAQHRASEPMAGWPMGD